MIRAVLDDYPGRMAVGEIWVADDERFARYVRPDELHLGFNFRLRAGPVRRGRRPGGDRALAGRRRRRSGAPPTWTLSNHDVVPARSPATAAARSGRRGPGRWRWWSWRCPAWSTSTTARSSGLPDVELPDEALQDPVWERSGRTERGRDALPGADAVGGRRARLRVHHAATRGCRCPPEYGDAHRRPTSWRTPARCCRCSGGRSSCARPTPASPGDDAGVVRRPGRLPRVPPHRRHAGLRAERLRRPVPLPAGRGAAGQRPARRRPCSRPTPPPGSPESPRPSRRSSSARVAVSATSSGSAVMPPADHRAVAGVEPQPGAGGRHPHRARRPVRCRRGTPSRTARTGSAAAPSPRAVRPADTVSTVWSSSDAGGPMRAGVLPGHGEPALGEPLQLRGRHVVDRLPARRGGSSPGHETARPGVDRVGALDGERGEQRSSPAPSRRRARARRARCGWRARRTAWPPTPSPVPPPACSRTSAAWSSRTTRATNAPRSPRSAGSGTVSRGHAAHFAPGTPAPRAVEPPRPLGRQVERGHPGLRRDGDRVALVRSVVHARSGSGTTPRAPRPPTSPPAACPGPVGDLALVVHVQPGDEQAGGEPGHARFARRVEEQLRSGPPPAASRRWRG